MSSAISSDLHIFMKRIKDDNLEANLYITPVWTGKQTLYLLAEQHQQTQTHDRLDVANFDGCHLELLHFRWTRIRDIYLRKLSAVSCAVMEIGYISARWWVWVENTARVYRRKLKEEVFLFLWTIKYEIHIIWKRTQRKCKAFYI